MRRERLVGVVRVGIGDLRLAPAADAQLEEVAERTIAALSADQSLDGALVDVVLARKDRRRERRRRRMSVQGLRQVQAPDAVGRSIRPAMAAVIGAAARVVRIGRVRRSIPGDIDPPVVAGGRPGEDVVVKPRRRNRDRR